MRLQNSFVLFFLLKGENIPELKINEGIRAKKLLVIAPDGVQIGELELKKALIVAEQLDLDLVEVSPESKPPVARLMDYGKYKYELAQKAKESKKKQVKISVKEIQLKPKIDTHDFKIKDIFEWLHPISVIYDEKVMLPKLKINYCKDNIHPNNYLSSAYYVKAPYGCGNIKFYNPNEVSRNRFPSETKSTEFSANLRSIEPKASFGADLITGFPTETQEMFNETKRLIEDLEISHL